MQVCFPALRAKEHPCLRILHVIDELKVGGAQTHLDTMLAAAGRRHGTFQHRVVALGRDDAIGERIRAKGVPVDALGLDQAIRQGRLDRVAASLRRIALLQRPDVFEAHLTWSRLLGLSAAWSVRVPLRIGYEQGDIYFNSPVFRAANFTLQLAAHRVVVCSSALGEWAHQTHGISRDRLWVLHNCVDVSSFVPRAPARERSLWGFPKHAVIFACVGSLGLGVNKRVDICIRALALAREAGADAALLVVGDGSQRDTLNQLAHELNVANHVRFLGLRDDIPIILQNVDVFCHAAPFEPFGIVCVEAMATALPVIAPDQGGMREAVVPDQTGLLYRTLDPAALGQAIERLARHPEYRMALGTAGRIRAERHFSADTYVDTLYQGYAELLARSGSTQRNRARWRHG